MVVKATADALERVGKVVSALHSYDIPEVIALAVAGGNAACLDWVRTEVIVSRDGDTASDLLTLHKHPHIVTLLGGIFCTQSAIHLMWLQFACV